MFCEIGGARQKDTAHVEGADRERRGPGEQEVSKSRLLPLLRLKGGCKVWEGGLG